MAKGCSRSERQTTVFVLVRVNILTGRRQIVRELPLPLPAGGNMASCLKKNTPASELVFILIELKI